MKSLAPIRFVVALGVFLAGLWLSMSSSGSADDPQAHDQTKLALRQMKYNSEVYRDADDRVTGESLPELVATLEALGGSFSEDSAKLLNAGLDGWGRDLILEKRSATTWMLRSRGPNGVDEQGEGDDMEVDLHPEPRPDPSGGESGSCNCDHDEEPSPASPPADDPTQQPTPAKRES